MFLSVKIWRIVPLRFSPYSLLPAHPSQTQQQAEELAKLSSLRTQWAQEAEDLKAECETFRSLYDSAHAEAEKSKEEFIAVVEDQARSQKEMTNAARLEAEQMQARVRELEEEVEQGRSREEVRRQLERDLDVAHAALRQSQAVVQATEEARERVEVQSQQEGVIHEAQLAEWMAKAAAVTSERKGLEARIEGLEKELAQAVEERRGKRLELEEAAEEIGRLREALEISERAVKEGRRKATREGEELRRAWREEKSEWDEKIERLERQVQRTETEMKELRRERLVADERLAASEENTRHGAGEEARRLQERVADLEEALEEERVRGIKVENDWKFVVRDLHRQLRGPTPPERCPHADSMAPGIGAEAEEMAATARDQSLLREERQEEDLRAMTLLREELEKVKLRSMLAIQKAERRADAYKSKCLELHERRKEGSVVGGL